MIEQGVVLLVQGDPDVSAIAISGGFLGMVPEGTQLPTWSHFCVSDPADYTLTEIQKLGKRLMQIDCYGNTAAETLLLAAAIDGVLSGYKGTLADTDETVVQGCFRSNQIDFFDVDSRTYRRMLEYEIWS